MNESPNDRTMNAIKRFIARPTPSTARYANLCINSDPMNRAEIFALFPHEPTFSLEMRLSRYAY